MQDLNLPHRRYNPLLNEWVLVSPQRLNRPWNGKVEEIRPSHLAKYEPNCYLCPGNKRTNSEKNPVYKSTFVFTNDHPALVPQTRDFSTEKSADLFRSEAQPGTCRVVCYSPIHSLSMRQMTQPQILEVIKTWFDEYKNLGGKKNINYVQIFENKGELMGTSNPHPHGQIWASEHLPTIPAKEQKQQSKYFEKNRRPLLLNYLMEEKAQNSRLVLGNNSFAALVPFWAVWPYETMIIPTKSCQSLLDFNNRELIDLAHILKNITGLYDRLFNTPFPYSLGIHQAPTDGKKHPEWQLHVHFYPPLLRSATIKKYFVGYELLAEPQRDITPEAAAARLRRL